MNTETPAHTILLGLGSNLDDPLGAIGVAVHAVAHALEDVRASAAYRTPPEGGADQPEYVNAVVRGRGRLSPSDALSLARRLEDEAGRERPYPGASRTLDVDVLFVGDTVVDTPELRVPHPRWAHRDFVVVPLLDVAPDWIDPETGRSVSQIAEAHGWTRERFPVLADPDELLRGSRR